MIKVIRLVYNHFQVNTFLVVDVDTNETVVIDPTFLTDDERSGFKEYVEKNNLKLVDAVVTHAHIDHIQGVKWLLDNFGIGYKMSEAGMNLFDAREQSALMFQMEWKGFQPPVSFLKEGDVIRFGESTLRVVDTPGHADGSICLINDDEKMVFTGDLLFKGSIGRTDLPGGDYDLLMKSLNDKVLCLDDETTVYPGHGPRTTIKLEKQSNPFFDI